jgi:hypothetical protein
MRSSRARRIGTRSYQCVLCRVFRSKRKQAQARIKEMKEALGLPFEEGTVKERLERISVLSSELRQVRHQYNQSKIIACIQMPSIQYSREEMERLRQKHSPRSDADPLAYQYKHIHVT